MVFPVNQMPATGGRLGLHSSYPTSSARSRLELGRCGAFVD